LSANTTTETQGFKAEQSGKLFVPSWSPFRRTCSSYCRIFNKSPKYHWDENGRIAKYYTSLKNQKTSVT